MSKIELRAHAAIWNRAVQFALISGNAAAEPIIMKEREPGSYFEPAFELDYAQAQTLMDDLWIAGLRPTEGTGSAGALSATQKHLEDMRRLVFKDV